jgi:hypothetical protein
VTLEAFHRYVTPGDEEDPCKPRPALVQSLTFNATNPAYFGGAAWIGNDAFVVDDWDGAVKEWKRDGSGMFALASAWSEGMQTLGIAVLPDLTRLVVGGSDGFVFLAP